MPAGTVSAIGDIDEDGYADIAVGNPAEPSADPWRTPRAALRRPRARSRRASATTKGQLKPGHM
ncbi:FG-GAP repeat protein [Streptomyces sp. NPDC001811]